MGNKAIRICTNCGKQALTETELDGVFVKSKSSKFGYSNECLVCRNSRYYSLEYIQKYRKDNKEKLKPQQQKQCKNWRENNRDRHNEKEARRRATKLKQTPILTELEKKAIIRIYRVASIMSNLGRKKYHVDHIKPLCKGGMHHPSNLQVLEARLNISKGGKYNV